MQYIYILCVCVCLCFLYCYFITSVYNINVFTVTFKQCVLAEYNTKNGIQAIVTIWLDEPQ